MPVPESEQDKALSDPMLGTEQQQQELAALYLLMHEKGWPTDEENHDLCMKRAREFLDCAALIYPRP